MHQFWSIIQVIVNKYKVRNEPLLHMLIDFMMDNIGSEMSVRSITDSLAGGKAADGYKKMIIARTYQPEYHHEGIKIIDAAEWLLGDS